MFIVQISATMQENIYETCSEDISDDEVYLTDHPNDDEEDYYMGSISKLQFRYKIKSSLEKLVLEPI